MEDKARFVAVSTLYDMEVKGAYSNIKLNEYFVKYDLSSIDRGFATELLYGTVRWKAKIDYLIQKSIKNNINEIAPWTLVCLRTAIYQIYFMDKVPEFAAVNEAVKLVKMKADRATSFVNGVLRSILRNKDEFDNIGIKNKTKRLAIQYSHPEWFVKKFGNIYGEEFITELMRINNTPPELSARVNTLKTTREELINLLSSEGCLVQKGNAQEAIVFNGYSMIEKSKEFNEGYFIFQDESSMLVAKVLDPKPGNKVVDLCSAPGGKTTHIAQLMENKGEVIAFDIHEHKLELINDNTRKLGIKIIKTDKRDATILNEDLESTCDRVLVDAPCSGLGLIRKKPEIRWNIKEEDLLSLKNLQKKILYNASKYVRNGGVLVYSTCTISEEENEEVIKEFLSDTPNFELEDIEGYLPEKYLNKTAKEGYIKLFPNVNGCDGFFIARLRRKW